ncbi:PP2C family serine/threonine-protein phosphatase [Algoriphagus confluentis]|uniref:Stp1/IreP family PP2C-type Ser/Thr phosphatase n=1 Tax=Algoriphagus confluentis TaxID=1697556 RepID=A0ABQ6PJD0_9BACT|nr:Stp1/IreP family PP2C-type Ser/Thr phosphatase [Algoriphagus confluentis]
MNSIALSHAGKRETNQDLILEYTSFDGTYLFSVIDGMGGYEYGEIASKLVSENILAYLSTIKTIDAYHIQKAINKSNLAIRQRKNGLQMGMGATIGGIIIKETYIIYFWIGDVKILHFRNKKLLFESLPHSLVNKLIESGSITEGTQLSKFRHVVTRSIQGNLENSQAEIHSSSFKPDTDLIFICSDGVHDQLESLQVENLLNKVETPLAFKEALEEKLLIVASDNFTFGIITSN